MHVLIAVDESDPAQEAFEFAVATFPNEDLTALHVIDPYGLETRTKADLDDGTEPIIDAERRNAESLFESCRDVAGEKSIHTDTVVGKPEREIVEYTETEPIDHVVIGSHGRSGLSRVLLGSVAESVARESPVPITIVR